jgi:multiple sugar transport system substrate-binding protein
LKKNLKFKNYKIAIILLIFTILFTFGCNLNKKKEPISITIWHHYGGQMQDVLDDLIAEFNLTLGAENGIVVSASGLADTNFISEKLIAAANQNPGAPKLPDLSTAYPNAALILANMGILADYETLFTREELDKYVPEFLEEGRLGKDKLYLLPIAKSTEVLYLNRTAFDRFSKDTGVDISYLETIEGIVDASRKYYRWTDAQTPDIPDDGKPFFYSNSLFNYALIGMEQLGFHLISDQKLNLSSEGFTSIWENYCLPAAEGSIAISDSYANYLAQYGKIICATSSSAGAIFYPDSVTYLDNTKEPVVFEVLPYPIFAGGKKIAIQRGAGMLLTKSTPEREKAAAIFLKWFTAPKQNLTFAVKAGYLPVSTEAFQSIVKSQVLDSIEDSMIKKSILTVIKMQNEYHFFYIPIFVEYDELQLRFTERIKRAAQDTKYGIESGNSHGAQQKFIDNF